jgi:hypothetical protein
LLAGPAAYQASNAGWGKGDSSVRRRLILIALVVAVAGVMVFGGTAFAGKPSLRTAVTADLTRPPDCPDGLSPRLSEGTRL